VSNAAPVPSENVSVSLSFVNPSADPLKEITVKAKIGDADYIELQKFSMSSEPQDEIVTKSFTYQAPASAKTAVVLDMVITSQKKYPQIQRATLTTK
jgi:hypothetical protein